MNATPRAFSSATSGNPISRRLRRLASPERDVQIWIANLDSFPPGEIESLSASLDPAESTRAVQFRFKQDRQRYRAAHALLRHLLGSSLHQPAQALVFEHTPRGKPSLAPDERGSQRLRFNLSHAAGWALFALAWDREVGADLESNASLPADDRELDALATRILSPRELSLWRATPDRAALLLRAWTRKEACVKASGEGMRRELATIEVLSDSDLSPVLFRDDATSWIVHDLSVPAGLAAAIAIEQRQ
jgi:4'-phosphopantetheinyl transferase